MSMAELREIFYQECEDLVEAMAHGLRLLDEGETEAETINSIFRAVHSIKGGAGAFALDALVQFAHGFETTLDGLRSGRIELNPSLTKLLMQAGDHLSDLVSAARAGREPDLAEGEKIAAELEEIGGGEEEVALDFTPMPLSFDLDFGLDLPEPAPEAPSGKLWHIRFQPNAELYANGHDPALLFLDLERLGKLTVTLLAEDLPSLDTFDWQQSYLTWEVLLQTDHSRAEIEDIFDFVVGLCQLDISEAPAPGPFPVPQPEPLALSAEPLPSPSPEQTAAPAPNSAPRKAEPSPEPDRARSEPGRPRATIRVDLDRVDRLINVVGELVINQAMLAQAIESAGLGTIGSDVGMGLDELKQLSREIQEGVMAIRAQPVKPLFDRMYRIVRECAEASGKSARLVISGENTEVDKTVVEKLADPLTHMIRNAVDHGLEPPDRREAIGKSGEGTINLTAQHRSGRVIITLSDDGGGINRERVREIAIERGLITPDADLTPSEIDNLLFLPGFSTAKELSKLSGRGVGLDVVKSAIAELGGRVSIQSSPGTGTAFSISLPLTLAVLDGMIVRVAEQQLVVPITAIVETLRPASGDIQSLGAADHVMAVRGSYVPVVDVGASLGFRGPLEKLDGSVIVLIEGDHDSRVALAVDTIQDQRQVVIKSLEGNYGQVPGIAAATVLGDGRIALILDTNSLAAPPISLPPIAAE